MLGTTATLLAWAGRNGTALSAGALFLGLAMPGLAAIVRPWLGVVVTVMLTLALVMTDRAALGAALRKPVPLLAAAVVMAVGTPLAVAASAPWVEPLVGPGLMLGLYIFAFAPPTLSSPAFAALMGLDAATALALCLGLTLVSPLLIPAVAALAGVDFPLDTARLAARLATIVLPAGAAALLLRRLLGPETIASRSRHLTGLLMVPLVLFAIGSMDGMVARAAAEPLQTSAILLLSFALAAAGMVAVGGATRWAGRETALAFGWCGGNRNLGLLVGTMATAVPDDAWAYFALAQFPIYTLPWLAQVALRAPRR